MSSRDFVPVRRDERERETPTRVLEPAGSGVARQRPVEECVLRAARDAVSVAVPLGGQVIDQTQVGNRQLGDHGQHQNPELHVAVVEGAAALDVACMTRAEFSATTPAGSSDFSPPIGSSSLSGALGSRASMHSDFVCACNNSCVGELGLGWGWGWGLSVEHSRSVMSSHSAKTITNACSDAAVIATRYCSIAGPLRRLRSGNLRPPPRWMKCARSQPLIRAHQRRRNLRLFRAVTSSPCRVEERRALP